MIHYDIEPSLYSADKEMLLLDDGFSAPRERTEADATLPEGRVSLEDALASKSDF